MLSGPRPFLHQPNVSHPRPKACPGLQALVGLLGGDPAREWSVPTKSLPAETAYPMSSSPALEPRPGQIRRQAF